MISSVKPAVVHAVVFSQKEKKRNSPERKEQCTKFVAATVKKTAEIILREL